jgi:hypothetical protein
MTKRVNALYLVAAGFLGTALLFGACSTEQQADLPATSTDLGAVSANFRTLVGATVQGEVMPGHVVTVTPAVEIRDGSVPLSLTWRQKSGLPVGLAPAANSPGNFHVVARGSRHQRFEGDAVQVTLPWSWTSPRWTSADRNAVTLELTVRTTTGTYVKDVALRPSERVAAR